MKISELLEPQQLFEFTAALERVLNDVPESKQGERYLDAMTCQILAEQWRGLCLELLFPQAKRLKQRR